MKRNHAVDVCSNRLRLARQLGAEFTIDATKDDPIVAIGEICPGGVDLAVEASGRPDVMRQALSAVRARGGAAVVVGNARHGESMQLDPKELNLGKRLLGTWGGDNLPERDFPRYQSCEGPRRPHKGPDLAGFPGHYRICQPLFTGYRRWLAERAKSDARRLVDVS